MRVRLWRVTLGAATSVRAAHQVHADRDHLFLEIRHEGVVGLGEVAPQPTRLNGDPGVEEVLLELEDYLLPMVEQIVTREGGIPHWSRVPGFSGSRVASATAIALVQSAVLDWDLRVTSRHLRDHWPVRFDPPRQATVSLIDAGEWPDVEGVSQVRAKVHEGPLDPGTLRRLGDLGRPVLVDFNCSAQTIEGVRDVLTAVADVAEIIAVEQPFAPGNVVEHARLAEVVPVAVSLDEGVRHRRDLDQIARYGAASMVGVKIARVGGPARAITMIDHARSLGLRPYVGGFFESPLARAMNRAVAQHLVEAPSDIAPVALTGTVDLLVEDRWGCGYLPGEGLEARDTVLNREF